MLIHPFGRVCFEKLDGLSQCDGRWEMKQDMRVLGHTIDGNSRHCVVATNASQIRPELRPNIFSNDWLAIIRSENKMDVIFNEGVRQGLCRPFRARIIYFHFPALTRWAQ